MEIKYRTMPIKLRAWDKKYKRWEHNFFVNKEGQWRVFDDEDGGKSGLWEHDISDDYDLKLMMFTGLYDKYGTRIYEGDILVTSQTDPKSDYDMWEEEEYGYTVVEWSTWHCQFRGSRWTWFQDSSTAYGLDFIKVIGNIYENPELIYEPTEEK